MGLWTRMNKSQIQSCFYLSPHQLDLIFSYKSLCIYTLKNPNDLQKSLTWSLKSEIQSRSFRANCEEGNLLVVIHCLTLHNQVREIFPKEIHEDSRPGLDTPSPGKKSNRTPLEPEKSDLENSNLF